MKENIASSSCTEELPESILLKSKMNEIRDKMSDADISDDDYEKLSKEFRNIKEISQLKNNSFELKETYKALLDESIIKEYNDTKNTNIIKECIDKNILKIEKIKNVFNNIEEYSNTYKYSLKEEDIKELENNFKSLQGRIKIIDEEKNKFRK
ncbi:hypothetical protein OGZ02_00100 [Brachyspira hyodysenteriae]|nr:hypothetical protein [Brachyspira hyodysenteriae]MDA1467278.1 hypothetical protein [Brachyspira hyodysenteriae]